LTALPPHPLALAALLLLVPLGAKAQMRPLADDRGLPMQLEADEVRGRPDLDFVGSSRLISVSLDTVF